MREDKNEKLIPHLFLIGASLCRRESGFRKKGKKEENGKETRNERLRPRSSDNPFCEILSQVLRSHSVMCWKGRKGIPTKGMGQNTPKVNKKG